MRDKPAPLYRTGASRVTIAGRCTSNARLAGSFSIRIGRNSSARCGPQKYEPQWTRSSPGVQKRSAPPRPRTADRRIACCWSDPTASHRITTCSPYCGAWGSTLATNSSTPIGSSIFRRTTRLPRRHGRPVRTPVQRSCPCLNPRPVLRSEVWRRGSRIGWMGLREHLPAMAVSVVGHRLNRAHREQVTWDREGQRLPASPEAGPCLRERFPATVGPAVGRMRRRARQVRVTWQQEGLQVSAVPRAAPCLRERFPATVVPAVGRMRKRARRERVTRQQEGRQVSAVPRRGPVPPGAVPGYGGPNGGPYSQTGAPGTGDMATGGTPGPRGPRAAPCRRERFPATVVPMVGRLRRRGARERATWERGGRAVNSSLWKVYRIRGPRRSRVIRVAELRRPKVLPVPAIPRH